MPAQNKSNVAAFLRVAAQVDGVEVSATLDMGDKPTLSIRRCDGGPGMVSDKQKNAKLTVDAAARMCAELER